MGRDFPRDVLAEEQILAEIARPHLFAQVNIGCGHDAHIHLDGASAPGALDLPFLQAAPISRA